MRRAAPAAALAGRHLKCATLTGVTCALLLMVGGIVPAFAAADAQQAATASAPASALLFDDEFAGASLDQDKWLALDLPGNPNNGEQQCYTPANVAESAGELVLTSKVDRSCPDFAYTSGGVMTRTFAFTYGTVEIRAKLPPGRGTWPALWLLGADCQKAFPSTDDWCPWPVPGSDEIDIVELAGQQPTHPLMSLHYGQQPDKDQGGIICRANGPDLTSAFHIYRLDWQPGRAVWSIDGRQVCAVDHNVPAHPMFLIMDTALGGNIGGPVVDDALPTTLRVDYVRVYRPGALAPPRPPAGVSHDGRYFPQTGFRVDNDAIWDYFEHRGGVRTFGYPTSRTFRLQGFTVQFFQRRVVQLDAEGRPRVLNLLDRDGPLPYLSFNGSTFPAVDPALAASAPAATDQRAVLAWVRQHAPAAVAGMPVNFYETFASTVDAATAFPRGGDLALLPGFDLELWGVPTSRPAVDPRNHQFVYLRWQRGIMQYDAGCRCTQGVLLADYFKALLTGQNLPADLAAAAEANSGAALSYLRQYDPAAPLWVRDPSRLPGTDLTDAFTPE